MANQAIKNQLIGLMQLMRPGQWVKNVFVAAPLLFAQKYVHKQLCLRTVEIFIGFCLASSAIYIFNDYCDRNEDQQHPVKKNRPLASGSVNPAAALFLSSILIVVSLLLSILLNRNVVIVTTIFVTMNIAYSLGLKHLAILDVMTIAAGFVLRILAGSSAIGVDTSHWLVLCTIMIAMFLGFTKRRAELVGNHEDPAHTRTVLKDYSIKFLDQVIAIVTGATIICYALYTVDARTHTEFGSHSLVLTVPFVIYGIFRYIYLTYHLDEGEDPTSALFKDWPMLVTALLWVIATGVIVKLGTRFTPFG